mmetsp:Transcript_33770/g.83525  ORF Transcript_33770/g.83525 Transcript_33770/m.83525 type:complete len:90 (-) Transcript_33770:10-279(-)
MTRKSTEERPDASAALASYKQHTEAHTPPGGTQTHTQVYYSTDDHMTHTRQIDPPPSNTSIYCGQPASPRGLMWHRLASHLLRHHHLSS